MITLQSIKRYYGMPIKRKFCIEIDNYIDKPIVQSYLRKALAYKLNNNDYDWLFEHGGFPSAKCKPDYPYLSYLCSTYIHPLTHAQNCLRLADKLLK